MRSLALAAMAGPVDNPKERSGLLAAARSGDLTAFERLMRQYERLVLVTALRLAGNLPDAQDVSQEVFLKLYRNLGKVASQDAVASWLYRVTVNACHDLRRRRLPEDPVENAGELAAGGADPHQALTESERGRALELSLRMLPEKDGRRWCCAIWRGSLRRKWHARSGPARPRCARRFPKRESR
jgi:RNA polymerase sigma-70 factor (ECF subfamily)